MTKVESLGIRRGQSWNLLLSIIIVLSSVVIGGVLVFLSGKNPISAYATILLATFGSTKSAISTFELSAPLIFVSLGLLLAFRTSFWNAGGEGQMLLGGLTAVMVTYELNLSNSLLMIIAGAASAFVVGGTWASLSGILKVRFNVDDIVSSLLLYYIAQYLVFYLVRVPFRATGSVTGAIIESVSIPSAAVFPYIDGICSSIFLAILCAIIVYLVLTRTKFGFKTRVIGTNRQTAMAYFGATQANRLFVLVCFLSGGLIGLGGMVMTSFTSNIVAGATGGAYSTGGFTSSYGFIGIAIVFLAQLNPIGVIPGSIFFVALVTGGLGLVVRMGIPADLTLTISGIAVLVLSMRETVVKRLLSPRKKPMGQMPVLPEGE